MSTRDIDREWHLNIWFDVADDLAFDGVVLSGYGFDWAERTRCLAWCLRDAGMAAAMVAHEYRSGYSDGWDDRESKISRDSKKVLDVPE